MDLADEGTHQMLQRELRYALVDNHRVVDAASAVHRVRDQAPRKERSLCTRCGAVDYDDTTADTWSSLAKTGWSSARHHRGGVDPDLEQGHRARGSSVLQPPHRLARQLNERIGPDDRQDFECSVQVTRVV